MLCRISLYEAGGGATRQVVYHHITVQLYDTAVLRYDLSTAHTAVPTGTRSLPLPVLESTLVSCYLQHRDLLYTYRDLLVLVGPALGVVPFWCLGGAFLHWASVLLFWCRAALRRYRFLERRSFRDFWISVSPPERLSVSSRSIFQLPNTSVSIVTYAEME